MVRRRGLVVAAVGALYLAACVATEATLNKARQEAADGHISILKAIETGETRSPLREQYRASERIQADTAKEAETSKAFRGLLEGVAALATGGGAVVLSRLLSSSKPRLNEHDRRLQELEVLTREKK